ncbi:hypothetical protein HPB52_003630 [Rhipicephalus sanguineus]|uniref:Uncharacterized protein n=1 Tax=Rhipicephalus sanguineus TaxID=34632 RepID=A0A9D4PC86_RHISA|nr:hypothetical protein HPB52_003630 [Rhipicephalus sanguineus]
MQCLWARYRGITEPCRKRSGSHATADCIRPKSFAAAAAPAADEQEGNDLSPPAPAPQEEFPALETESDTDTPDTESHAESQDAGDLPPPSENVSSTPGAPAENSDSSPDAYEDHSASKAEAPVSVPSRDHESCSSDTDKTTTMIMPPTATSTRASKYPAQTRKLSLSNPLHKITGSAAVMSDGASAMEIERQATKRAHPPTTDSEGSTDSKWTLALDRSWRAFRLDYHGLVIGEVHAERFLQTFDIEVEARER